MRQHLRVKTVVADDLPSGIRQNYRRRSIIHSTRVEQAEQMDMNH
jgi:hypothetical protein